MNPSDANDLKILVDYVTQIRGQDVSLFQTLMTIFTGTILGAILVAVLLDKKGEPIFGWRRFVAIFALVLFVFFIAGLGSKYIARREFCQKWLGGICNNIATYKTVPALIEDFSRQRYGLYYANPKDRNFKLRPEYIPEGWVAEKVWQHRWIVDGSPYLSVIFAFILVFTRPSQKVKESEISIRSSGSPIEAEGKLKIN